MTPHEISVEAYRLMRQPGGASDSDVAAFRAQLTPEELTAVAAQLPTMEEPAKRCFITRTIKEFLERCLAASQQEGEAATKE